MLFDFLFALCAPPLLLPLYLDRSLDPPLSLSFPHRATWQAIDIFFDAAAARLDSLWPSLESSVLREVVQIPSNVLLGSEMAAAADGFGAASLGRNEPPTPAETQEDLLLEQQLAHLQQRLVKQSKMNRQLRTECKQRNERRGTNREASRAERKRTVRALSC